MIITIDIRGPYSLDLFRIPILVPNFKKCDLSFLKTLNLQLELLLAPICTSRLKMKLVLLSTPSHPFIKVHYI